MAPCAARDHRCRLCRRFRSPSPPLLPRKLRLDCCVLTLIILTLEKIVSQQYAVDFGGQSYVSSMDYSQETACLAASIGSNIFVAKETTPSKVTIGYYHLLTGYQISTGLLCHSLHHQGQKMSSLMNVLRSPSSSTRKEQDWSRRIHLMV